MKLWLRILIALVIIGIIAIFLVYKFVYNKPHPDYKKEKAVYTLSAKDLYEQFKQDSTKAKKYVGQVIEVQGNLSSVETPDSLVVAVFEFEQGMFGAQGVRITMLPEYAPRLKQITAGTAIKIKGYCTGCTDDVVLEQGSIVE